ncbi:MAG: glycoside hydrolase family 127 protein [Rikenellaceae bacterium]|jgi:DUF1680 family protein|nr:glycoside hydrolase family 127 protein [Rikenellaceae bacterium]
MKKIIWRPSLILCGAVLMTSACCRQQEPETFKYFPLSQVELLDSPFKQAQERDLEYILSLDADRLAAPFLREAGLEPKAESYPNWENTGLDGHIGGHYLSALALMSASTGDSQIADRLAYYLGELKRAQDAAGNGFLGGTPDSKALWSEIAAGDIRAAAFSLNDRWVPLYNIHKTYAGLRDVWLYTGNPVALEMFVQLVDWMDGVTANLSDEQMQDMLRSEHGGLNEVFADAAAITGEERYLRLAHRFSQQSLLDPLYRHNDRLTGMHANTQIPKVIGYKRIAEVEGNDTLEDVALFFWNTVTENRSVVIGGNSTHEHFNPIDDYSTMTSSEQGPESCNTYNMLRLTMKLNATAPDAKFGDFYEKALYNHILSTQNPHTGGLVYFTPMRPAHYKVYSQPETSMWCCVGSGMESHAKYGEMIYAHRGASELYVNLFIPSVLTWEDAGVVVRQENSFPSEAATHLTVETKRAKTFTLKIRYPEWTEGMTVMVNDEPVAVEKMADGFVAITRRWRGGDRVDVAMPMYLSLEELPDHSAFRAVTYGPVVLASRDGEQDLVGQFADDSRNGHIAAGPKIPAPFTISVDGAAVDELVQPAEGELRFVMQTSAGPVELEPFWGLQESRYTVYFPIEQTNE